MHKDDIKKIIAGGINCNQLDVLGDDGAHFEALIISDDFKSLNRVKRHQLVYQALGDLMNEKIHALSLKLYDLSEWNEIKGEKK